MKILITHFKIQDWGGIVNYSEFMARGLKQLGHEVSSVMLKNKGATGTPTIKDRKGQQGWEYGDGLGLWMHQKQGWEGMFQINYGIDGTWENYADQFDLVLHHIPVPTCTKANKNDSDWVGVFDKCFADQLVVVHDGNMQKLYPHILHICDKINGVICVHDASFNSCEVLPVNRMFIPNPHELVSGYIKPMSERTDGIVSLQTFKRWKRVDDLIRAIPYMDEFHDKIICGGGIEQCYMTSLDKCKPEYHDEAGTPIWDVALDSGMEFKGYVTTNERDALLDDYKLLVDPSWSKNYSKLGCHFNRVMIEAMCHGCVPVCTDLAMNGSSLFEAGENYIEIPYDSSPEQYGRILNAAILDEERLDSIQNSNLKLVKNFDKVEIAKAVLNFASLSNGTIGTVTPEFEIAAAKKMLHFEEF